MGDDATRVRRSPAMPANTSAGPRRVVVGHDLLDVGVLGEGHLEVPATLHPAADDRQSPRLHRDVAHRHSRHRRRAHLGDPAAVEQRDRSPRLGVVHDHRAVDVGQALGVVLLVARHPLEADAVAAAEVGGHRVDEGVVARRDLGLGRVRHEPLGLLRERVLDDVHDLGPGQREALEVTPVEDQEVVLSTHGGKISCSTATREENRSEPPTSRPRGVRPCRSTPRPPPGPAAGRRGLPGRGRGCPGRPRPARRPRRAPRG